MNVERIELEDGECPCCGSKAHDGWRWVETSGPLHGETAVMCDVCYHTEIGQRIHSTQHSDIFRILGQCTNLLIRVIRGEDLGK